MFDFSISKVITVCIDAYSSKYDIFRFSVTDLSQADFVSICQKYGLPNLLLALTHKLSHMPIPEMPDSTKFQ